MPIWRGGLPYVIYALLFQYYISTGGPEKMPVLGLIATDIQRKQGVDRGRRDP